MQTLRENGRLEVVGTAHTSSGVRSLVKSVVGGLRAWQQPEASTEGLGGTYFFMDENGKKTAIVKPCDEEPLAPNNPKVPCKSLSETIVYNTGGGSARSDQTSLYDFFTGVVNALPQKLCCYRDLWGGLWVSQG